MRPGDASGVTLFEETHVKCWVTANEAETMDAGQELAAQLPAGAVVLLEGDLGSGKTVFVRGMARHVEVDSRQVQSPTYNLIHEYEGKKGRLVHIDLYRLAAHEVDSLGLDEMLAAPGFKAVEWPERLPFEPPAAWRVTIGLVGDGRREILLHTP